MRRGRIGLGLAWFRSRPLPFSDIGSNCGPVNQMKLRGFCLRVGLFALGVLASGLLLLAAPPSYAQSNLNGCSSYIPGPGDTIVCSSAYASSTSGVQTPQNNTGNNNVTVNIDSTAVRSINGSTVGIGSGSTVNNAGSLNTQSFFYGYGISFGANGRSKAGGNTVNNSGSITTGGGNADGIHVEATNATAASNTIINSGTITTNGNSAAGIYLSSTRNADTITNSGTITTNGSTSHGLDITKTGSFVSITNSASGVIKTSGSGSIPILVSGAATINNSGMICAGAVSGGLCTSSGNTANAIQLSNSATSARSSITNNAGGLIVSPNGIGIVSSTAGVDISNSGTISGAVTALQFYNGSSATSNTVTLYGGSTTIGALAFNTYGSSEALTFSGFVSSNFSNAITGLNTINAISGASVILTNAAGYTFVGGSVYIDETSNVTINSSIADQTSPIGQSAITKTGPGTLTLAGANTYTGATNINAGTLSLTGSLASPTNVAAGATLIGTGTINGAVSNAGTISPGLGNAAGTLTIAGNYSGNNGTLATRIWGVPSSPQPDILVISGSGSVASGSTQIVATDRGGLGAPTNGDGILLVSAQNGAVTQAGAFTLGQRVAAGAYEYSLYRGGFSANSGQNWYLRTTIDPALSSGGAMPEPLPSANPTSTTAAAPVAANSEVPNYRVETAVYPGLQVAQRLYTYSLVDTLDQRRGSLSSQKPGTSMVPGGWGRISGVLGSTRVGEVSGPNLSYNYGFLQAGLDIFARETASGGAQFAGAFIAVGQSSAKTATASRGYTGQFGSNAYTVGLYATHFEANGLYADGLLQATRFAQAKANSIGGTGLSTDGWSGSASLEAGWRMHLSQQFYIVPQLQIVGDTFSINSATDAYGLMTFQNQTALRGRVGVLGGATFNQDQPEHAINVWLRASAWNVFAGAPKTYFETFAATNAVAFQSQYGSSWLGVDAGVTAQLSKQSALYANGGYDYGFGLSRQAFTGRLGLQVQW